MSNTNCCCNNSPPNPNTLCCNCYDPCKTPQKLTAVLTGGNAINGNCSCPDIKIPLQITGPCYWSGTAQENVCSNLIYVFGFNIIGSCINSIGEMAVTTSFRIDVDSITVTLTATLDYVCPATNFHGRIGNHVYTGSLNYTPMMDCSSIDLSIPLTVQGNPKYCCYFTLTVNS